MDLRYSREGTLTKALHIDLHCEGYYGFGSGYVRGTLGEEVKVYCRSLCPVSDSCWKKHQERVRALQPNLCATFDALEQTSQCRAVQYFEIGHDGRPNPFTALMLSNLEDGEIVAYGGKPRDRGDCTLTWPLGVEN